MKIKLEFDSERPIVEARVFVDGEARHPYALFFWGQAGQYPIFFMGEEEGLNGAVGGCLWNAHVQACWGFQGVEARKIRLEFDPEEPISQAYVLVDGEERSPSALFFWGQAGQHPSFFMVEKGGLTGAIDGYLWNAPLPEFRGFPNRNIAP